MPIHDGSWLDEDEGSVPNVPDAVQADPEEPVTVLEPHPPVMPLEPITWCRSAMFSSARSRRLFSAELTLEPTIRTQSHIDACSY